MGDVEQTGQDVVIRSVQPRHYFGIFVLACATLSYQILITRFFSVVLYYHFAFAAISLAMFGLTRGAMQVYSNPARYAPELVDIEFDITGDGIDDLVFASREPTGGKLWIFPGTPAGGFGYTWRGITDCRTPGAMVLAFLYSVQGVAVGDFDRDGKPDIVAVGGDKVTVGMNRCVQNMSTL